MIVVADASPIIFLAKIRRLGLVTEVLGRDLRMPRTVCAEILAPELDPVENRHLRSFIDTCTVVDVRRPRRFASAMSRADNELLTLALRCRARILLCDERIIRRVAAAEGIQPLGTLGILLKAMQAGHLPPMETRQAIDQLIERHAFRIGIELYQKVLALIQAEDP